MKVKILNNNAIINGRAIFVKDKLRDFVLIMFEEPIKIGPINDSYESFGATFSLISPYSRIIYLSKKIECNDYFLDQEDAENINIAMGK